TARSFDVVREEIIESQGRLDVMTWEEYKANNSAPTRMEVDDDFYDAVATATGISRDRITIIAYRQNLFRDKDGLNINWTDILSIAMIVIILALLAFVILRSMAVRKDTEQEEELSVENLLQSTPESELEDIEVETKSETRKLIEKFVDENPEAVANLLRNWLNEDWG
ncbi:MAG: flagellar M-ring protein FliF, partial [Acetatifactor sp.]|nr:flagellar M-ring protein FliF [Acetatifactor sp.]